MKQSEWNTKMENRYTRITVPLSQDEFIALAQAAQCDLRHPRDQARFLLRSALMATLISDTENNKTVLTVEAKGGFVEQQ